MRLMGCVCQPCPDPPHVLSPQAAVNTTLSAGFSALTCLALALLLGLPGDIGPVLNGEHAAVFFPLSFNPPLEKPCTRRYAASTAKNPACHNNLQTPCRRAGGRRQHHGWLRPGAVIRGGDYWRGGGAGVHRSQPAPHQVRALGAHQLTSSSVVEACCMAVL